MAIVLSDSLIIDRAGTNYKATASDMLDYITGAIGTSEHVVATIAARNAAEAGFTLGDVIFVTDASADATVTTGWAMYRYISTGVYTKFAEEENMDVIAGATNLDYTAAPTIGTVTSSTGTDATLPAATTTNAGLMLPAQFDKLAFTTITGAVNLDTLNTNTHVAATTAGAATNNPVTLTGQAIGFNISGLATAP